MIVGIAFILFFVFFEPSLNYAFCLFRLVTYNAQIGFTNFLLLELSVHSFQTFRGFSEKNDPSNRSVYSMNHSTKYIARLLIFLFEKSFNSFRKRHIAGFISLYNLPRFFIYSD